MTIQQKIEEGYMFGCVKYQERCSLYLMPIAYWILDYGRYDPAYNPNEWEFVFRDNIHMVSDDNIDAFIKAIEVDKVQSDDFYKMKHSFYFFIDFDMKLFVSSLGDVEVEEYVPDGWEGKYDDPMDYLPAQCEDLIKRDY